MFSNRIFNALKNKEIRKILKRKHSDAGEIGRSLEEIRASILDKLGSSKTENARQHPIFFPAVAMTFNFVIAICIIFMNKLVLNNVGFHFPIFLTLIHYTTSWLLLALLKLFSILPSPPQKSTFSSSLLTLGIVMALSTGLANVSLKYNSVGFYQMSKIAVTPSIVVAEFFLYRKKVCFSKAFALTIVSIGVAVATVTDLQLHAFGACVALAWIVPSTMTKILWCSLQQHENWSALALMWKITPITWFFLAMATPWLDPPGVLSFDWNFINSSAIFVSAFLGFLLQWSGALALGETSAISHVILGQFKTCVVLIGNYYLFGSDSGSTSVYGAITAIAGMYAYTYLNLKQHSPKKDNFTEASS